MGLSDKQKESLLHAQARALGKVVVDRSSFLAENAAGEHYCRWEGCAYFRPDGHPAAGSPHSGTCPLATDEYEEGLGGPV